MDSKPLRVGCVSYVNAYPLWRGLSTQPVFAPPVELYQMMERGECDVALLPSISLHHHPEWSIVSNTCIASTGPVMSVKLFHCRPIAECRKIFLDPESMTSNALLKIILHHHFHMSLDAVSFETGTSPDCIDAFLLIGDKALDTHIFGWRELDLGAAWQEMTGLPFVYAVWVGRVKEDPRYVSFATAIEKSLDESLATLSQWLPLFAAQRTLAPRLLENYLTRALHYYLTDECRAGLKRFNDEAASLKRL